jgi:hypothetical protein
VNKLIPVILLVDSQTRPSEYGEDRRTAGQTCALLLAIAGRRTSDAAAVWGDAGSDCSAPSTDGIERWWLV